MQEQIVKPLAWRRSTERLFPASWGAACPEKKGGPGMKDRKRQRENRRLKNREEALDKRSIYGYKDLTPYNAMLRIKANGKAQVTLR